MAIVEFERPFDWDPNVTKAVIKGEQHTIPTSPPYDIYLHHIPREESPSTVVIPGFTEVAGFPGPGEFRVHYTEVGGYPRGRITFNAVSAGQTVSVDYHACGTVIWAEDRGDGRPNIAELQEVLERVQEAGGIDYSSSVAGFSSADVAAALDALAGVRIVEMGSNSNGTYVRWENGLQVCWFANDPTPDFTARTEGAVSGYVYGDNWTYPAAFIANPSVAAIGRGFAGNLVQTSLNVSIADLSTTKAEIRFWAWNQVDADVTISRMAIGRWK